MSHNKITVNAKAPSISGDISVSLNDLSNVSYTAGAPIDNHVLTFDNNTGTWGAEPASVSPSTPNSISTGSNYSISNTTGSEQTYLINPSAAIDVTLPSAASAGAGFKYNVKNIGSSTITLKPATNETLDGVASTVGVAIATQYEALTVISDGSSAYYII